MRSTVFLIALAMALPVLAGCVSEENSDEPLTKTGSGQIAKVGGSEEEATAVPEGEYNFTGPFSRLTTKGDLEILPPQLIVVPSDLDGESIEMGVWLPDGPGPYPVLMFSSPYFHAADRASVPNPFSSGNVYGSTRTVTNPSSSVMVLIEEFVPHGYAFVTHAVRGTAGSGGCNDLMGPLETADIDQAVTWAGTQEWSNGNVAMTGVSYDGSTPWAAASTGNPHLKTIIPVSGVPDMHGLMYRNGSSETRGPLVLNALYYEIGIESSSPSEYAKKVLCPEAWEGVALSGVAGVLGTDPMGFWQERNRKPHVAANYEGSVFSIQGLQDWNVDPSQVVPWVEQLDQQGMRTKQLLGQWGHAWPDGIGENGERTDIFRADFKEILLRWLEQELKGIPQDTGPSVQVQDNQLRWRNEAHYPPRDTQWDRLHLTTEGRLAPTGSGGTMSLTLMPNLLEGQILPDSRNNPIPVGTYADFVWPAGEEDLLVVGLPKVHVTVTPHGPGGYMAAYLYHRDITGGTDELIGWTSMNLAYAAGGTERQEVIPGMPLVVNMEVQPMDAVVPAGDYLALRLWVFTDGDRLPTLPPNGVDLEIGAPTESVLILPTVQRDPDVYFEQPRPEPTEAE